MGCKFGLYSKIDMLPGKLKKCSIPTYILIYSYDVCQLRHILSTYAAILVTYLIAHLYIYYVKYQLLAHFTNACRMCSMHKKQIDYLQDGRGVTVSS